MKVSGLKDSGKERLVSPVVFYKVAAQQGSCLGDLRTDVKERATVEGRKQKYSINGLIWLGLSVLLL